MNNSLKSTNEPYYFNAISYYSTIDDSNRIFYGYILKTCFIDVFYKIFKLIDPNYDENIYHEVFNAFDTDLTFKFLYPVAIKNYFEIFSNSTISGSPQWINTGKIKSCEPTNYLFFSITSRTKFYSDDEKTIKRKQVINFLKEYEEKDNVCFL